MITYFSRCYENLPAFSHLNFSVDLPNVINTDRITKKNRFHIRPNFLVCKVILIVSKVSRRLMASQCLRNHDHPSRGVPQGFVFYREFRWRSKKFAKQLKSRILFLHHRFRTFHCPEMSTEENMDTSNAENMPEPTAESDAPTEVRFSVAGCCSLG